MTIWNVRNAAHQLATMRARDESGPCPHCGADADVGLIDVTKFGDVIPQFLWDQTAECSARCWLGDPAGYLTTVTGVRS